MNGDSSFGKILKLVEMEGQFACDSQEGGCCQPKHIIWYIFCQMYRYPECIMKFALYIYKHKASQ